MAEPQGGHPPGSVVVDDVWESFKIYSERADGIRDRLFAGRKNVAEEFWALQAITLRSVLLPEPFSPMSPIVSPGSMLELGAGFHGDLTGRENVYLNGSILGFSKGYVDKVIDDMVGFAGPQVEAAIERPVRTYSSGMYLRLGFAVAVHLQPDVLIIDEVLAVGDAVFQKQCFDRIHELKRNGVTIAVVSHDLDTLSSLCERGVWLEKGEVRHEGTAIDVVDRYRQHVVELQGGGEVGKWEGGAIYGSGAMTLDNIHLVTDGAGEGVATGDHIGIRFEVVATESVENPVFGLIVRANDGTYLYDTNTLWRRQATGTFAPGDKASVQFDIAANLLPGRYVCTVAASRHDGKQVYDWHTDALGFDVVGEFVANGLVALEGEITVEPLS